MANNPEQSPPQNSFPPDSAVPELPEMNNPSLLENHKKKINWIKAPPIILTVAVSLVIGFWLLPHSKIAPTIKKIFNIPVEEPEEEKVIVIDEEEKEEERRIVFIVPGEKGTTNASIYLKNQKTYEQSLVHTIDNYDSTHLNPYVQINGDLYVVRFSEEDDTRTESLWIYWKDGTYEKVYVGTELNYSIAPNGLYVGVISENIFSFVNISKDSDVKEQKFKGRWIFAPCWKSFFTKQSHLGRLTAAKPEIPISKSETNSKGAI